MVSSSIPTTTSKLSRTLQTNNKEDHEELVTITEKVNLTKNQYGVLNIICNTYEESVSQYMQEALVEAMRFDIEEGN
jgi:DNA-binding winged helix-turn-helix (wHTH) protein